MIAATGTLITAVELLFRQRRQTFSPSIMAQAEAQMPGAPPERLKQLADEEMRRELEFQRKALERLRRDLPKALAEPDATKRAAGVAQILEREKRYLRQREQAAAQRMVGALEMDLLRNASPQGAYWQLSPLLREHCPFCLAMAGKFWPWEVLDLPGMHLPIHPNCGCRLLALDEALAQGLMDADQLPDTEDAIRRAKILMREAKRLSESLAPEELQEAMEELEALRLQEVSARQILRFAKGTVKGGEFAPKRGGSAGPKTKREADLHSLRALAARGGSSPRQERLAGVSRKVTLRGQEHEVPVADAWQHTIAGTHYQSPPGGAHLYRDGILMGHDHPDFYETSLDEPARERPGVPSSDRGMDSIHKIKRSTVAKPIPDYTGTKLTIGKRAGGSTGAMWADDEHGDRWLVKTYGGDQDRIATELLSNAIYREMGAHVAEAGTWGAPGLPQFETIPDASIDEPPLPKGRRISTGIVVREADGSFWIYEPKGHFGGYEHTFPKGGLEEGLTAQQNAHKELWEETGLHAKITGFIGDFKGDTGTSRYYLAVRSGGEPHPDDPTPYVNGGSETAAVKRVTPEEAEQLLNRGRDKGILKAALELGVPEQAANPGPDEFPPTGVVSALTYQALPGEERQIDSPSAALGEHYMTDALLANWDFIGLTDDNVLWGPDGRPLRVDQGGTLQFRAQGGDKPFGPIPTEVWTMLGPKGQGMGKVQVSMGSMRSQASTIADRLTPARIDKLVDMAPFADTQMREEVRQSLKDRVGWMRRFGEGDESIPEPLEGSSARTAMNQWQSELDASPEEHMAVEDFVSNPKLRASIQKHLRENRSKDKASVQMQQAIKRLDALLRGARTDDDVTVYRPVDPALFGDLEELPGRTLRDGGFFAATTRFSDARSSGPGVLQLMVPSGSRALYTSPLAGDLAPDDESTNEVLLARGARVKVVSVEQRAGRTILNGVLVP